MKLLDLPHEPQKLAAWFAEAVNAELAELEKKGSEQHYELLAGQRLTSEKSLGAVFRFTLADDTRVPEDANGTIEVEGRQFKASVAAQEANRVDVKIDAAEALGTFVSRAILSVDDLALLRKLAEVLESAATGTESVSPLTVAIFHPNANGVCSLPLPIIPALDRDRVADEQRTVLEQAAASEVTFVWGPPGTGKTYVIAHLIATLIARGERVLMTSHTHAAVNQSIYETVKPLAPGDSKKAGPLHNSELERDGKIVLIGQVKDPKVPETVRLDSIRDRKARDIQLEINELHKKAVPLSSKRAYLNAQLAEWNRLNELQRRLTETERRVREAVGTLRHRLAEKAQASGKVTESREKVQEANRAWLFRARKVEKAQQALAAAERAHAIASKVAADTTALAQEAERAAESLWVEIRSQADSCALLPTPEVLKQQLIPINAELDPIERRHTELKERINTLERQVISDAWVVAATLTKCYVGEQLDGQLFDALIVDEISMALPPLLFIAARHAFRRVILVGDFKQLPPIVRGDSEIYSDRLRQDVFHLARIALKLEPTNHPALARLRTQQRMLPPIADVARHISYGTELIDHDKVLGERQPDWLAFLPAKALIIADTADLHCWCGRQAGSLSRFNLYSAQIAMELAARAAAAIPRPVSSLPPIGIVTPYAAQRRLLSRLRQALNLMDCITVGTVHTFQGGEAELIIFDCVLDDPYWTARLVNPNRSEEVERDLNVAVTRARSKFILVGSSEWLNRHAANPAYGLGKLWHYLKNHAELVSTTDLVKEGFFGRVAQAASRHHIPASADASAHKILDENEFFDFFATDLRDSKESIFGLVPFFGEYRWPKIEPLIREAIERGVEVTLITPPPSEAENKSYVEKVIRSLRQLGAVVATSTGLHGKDIVIDSRIHYTGSLNWASHRGRAEIMHRTENPEYAQIVLEYLQARHVRLASQQGGRPRTCPICQGPTQIVNQARPMSQWDKQPMKLGCADYQSTGCKYLVDIDQRPPFLEPPKCSVDQRTKYRRIKRGRGEVWECPKHPKQCERFRVVLGDP